MRKQIQTNANRDRIVASLPFVQGVARRVASSMPNLDVGDLVQDGMIGLIDAAKRFDESRGIKFETFAERRVRGAMIDALRKDAWPRGIRRVRRELELAREKLRNELGHEPALSDLAKDLDTDENQLSRTIIRIKMIESTSPLASGDSVNGMNLPLGMVPAEPIAPDKVCEVKEVRASVRAAISALPPRERKVIGMYYYGEITMKEIGVEIGVNESRVSQLHARAVQRLRKSLGQDLAPGMLNSLAPINKVMPLKMAKARISGVQKKQNNLRESNVSQRTLMSHTETSRNCTAISSATA